MVRVGCRADDADKHKFDVTSLAYSHGTLYSGGDDGKVKAWSSDLTKTAEVQSNPCSVYSLAASEDTLYSCSNEGTIKGFELGSLKEKLQLHRDEKTEYWKVLWANDALYSGDHEANIKVWKNNHYYGLLNVAEPVKDLAVIKDLVFSAKDLDIVVSDVDVHGDKMHHSTRMTMMGRAPITLLGEHLIAFISREATDILIYHINDHKHVTEFTKVLGASDKVINALIAIKLNGQDVLFSGGWDKKVKKWIIEGNSVRLDSSIDVEIVVNTIALGEEDEIYVGGGDGHIVRLEID